jgi:signal transduction histidine kinase
VAGEARGQTAAEQAERAIARLFVAARAGQIAFSALMVLGDRRRFSRPKLQIALLAGTVIESAWLANRILKAGRYRDRRAQWVDTAWSATGLVVCGAGLGPGESAPWMKNIAIGAALGASSSENPLERAGSLSLLGAAAMVAGVRAEGRDSHVAGLALACNDIISWTGMHMAVSTYMAAHRRQARLQDEADRATVAQATEAAAVAERSHQHGLVHRRTVEVLHALAASSDRESAGAVARLEAGRLRHILRTKGEVPTDLDSALYEVVETVAGDGFHVELVTTELLANVAPDAVAAIRAAVEISLRAARDVAGAERAVIRAVNDVQSVTVTVRHHAGGFRPGGGSPYDGPLFAIGELLTPVGGRAEAWSAEGRGVRVTLVVPVGVESAGQRLGHEPAQGIPDGRLGNGPARHDDGSIDQRDVDRRLVRRFVRSSQHEINGFRVFEDGHVGTHRQTLEPGAQQGPTGNNANGRGKFHFPRMASSPPSVLVRNTQFRRADGWLDESTRADRTIATLFMSWRFSGLATGLAASAAGRKRYRSQAAAAVQLLTAVFESAWLARRFAQNGYRFDEAMQGTDLGTAVLVLLVGRANLAPEDRWTWINWAPWSFAANAVSGRALDMEHRTAGALGTAAMIGTASALADRWADRIVNAGGMAACFGVSRVFVRQIHNGATRLEEARSEAIEEGRRLAVEQERSRQLRLLHDSALQTLEAVGSGRYLDLSDIRALVRGEAEILQNELDGTMPQARGLREAIESLVDEHSRYGLRIDLRVLDAVEPSGPVLLALRDASNEALVNVRKHAGTSRAEVLVEPDRSGVRVIVRDEGTGFDPLLGVGFGTAQSIAERMSEVGGSAEIESAPGRGTCVKLWGPT